MRIRTIKLSWLFIKEQLKEPIALFWIILSPSTLFYLLAATKQDPVYFLNDYTLTAGWFYAYISSSVALFGFSFYIIGRRESGFTRSFIYSPDAKRLFLRSHFLAYSLIALIYCEAFYLITRPAFGSYALNEALTIAIRFYFCFLLFCTIGMLLTLLPMNFQNSNTTFSILSFCMLALGIMGASSALETASIMNIANPLRFASRLMTEDPLHTPQAPALIVLCFWITYRFTQHNLRINPVWSRY